MIRKVFCIVFLFLGIFAQAQKGSKEFRTKKLLVQKDTIQIDTVNINPQKFRVLSDKGIEINAKEYQVDFIKALLILDAKKYSEITVEYFVFPEFITKNYIPFNKNLIVPNTQNTGELYSLTTNKKTAEIQLFEGLETKGNITRGLTIGNNQNGVVNSSLDLTIQGKLSKDITLRANIFDTNIPLQENGYSQNITDFDRIFIELSSKDWLVKAGDISLKNQDSYFLNFTKQVSGLEVEATISENFNASASGAIVRGRFASQNFVGLEGNQGPYKLLGPNNEPAIIIVAGSDKVFVNGTLLKRGENADYIIDYNIAEIRFNTTFPITNDMRIRAEFQYSDRNYTRFITYEKAAYKNDKFSVASYFYNENDAKNSPIQQNLSDEQKQILANAGNDTSKMVAQSAFLDEFSENRIQYKKIMVGTTEVFERSTTSTDELYSVTFTNVGTNNGSYEIDEITAIGTIFKYVGSNAGNYEPIVRLIAPSKTQIAVVNSSYSPSQETIIKAEVAVSNNDANLFSSIDDSDNKGLATKIDWQQTLLDKKWRLKTDIGYQLIQQNFKTIERFQTVEFNRDWNLINPIGNQSQFNTRLIFENKKDSYISYGFNYLKFSKNFTGSKHLIFSEIQKKETSFSLNSSFMESSSATEDNTFLRVKAKTEHSFTKSWLGGFVDVETNKRKTKATGLFNNLSHKYQEYESYFGIGDSTKTFTKFGVNYRVNDSIRNNKFTEINTRKTLYVQSKLIQNKTTNFGIYANYRITNNAFEANENTLNSKVNYQQRFFDGFLNLGINYETSSGNIARQEYVYVKTEPGQGYYTWIDYNNNGIQEFDEFEIAKFQDQAEYLRVPLPNLSYVRTQRAKWVQSVTLNPSKWSAKKGFQKLISQFYNQTFLHIDNQKQRIGNSFHFNPFAINGSDILALNFSFRNSLFFNRIKQNFSTSYTYGSTQNKQQFFIGNQESKTKIHQIDFQHKLTDFWLLDIITSVSENKVNTENFNNRNYEITASEINPKVSYVYNKNHKLSVFYQYTKKENKLLDFETLNQQNFGASYFYNSTKNNQISAEINVFLNSFIGDQNTPVAFQMLEGLQTGTNYTWNVLFNQKINSFLNFSMSYFGRKGEDTRAIHSGTVQLRANF